MLGHNTIGQPHDWLMNHIFTDLYTCQSLGIKNNYYVGILTDIDVNIINRNKKILIKYYKEVTKYRNSNTEKNFIKTINHTREKCSKIDTNFSHIIFHGIFSDIKVYIHLFILHSETNFIFDKAKNEIMLQPLTSLQPSNAGHRG